MSLEARLRSLELKVGMNPFLTDSDRGKSLENRIKQLEEEYDRRAPEPLRETWKESRKLMEELIPATSLTHQQQIVAPILYRKQEILAQAEDLAKQMRDVSQISQYLLINHPKPPKDKWTEDQVVQAPIVTETTKEALSEQDLSRLVSLGETVIELQHRTAMVTTKLDHLLTNYSALVVSMSEKMVLADELLRDLEAKKSS